MLTTLVTVGIAVCRELSERPKRRTDLFLPLKSDGDFHLVCLNFYVDFTIVLVVYFNSKIKTMARKVIVFHMLYI